MSLFIKMLPIYFLGNLHCMGMCGPLAMLLGQHRNRHWYFVGRTLSFGLAGGAAGEMGTVINLLFHHYQIPAMTCFIFGALLFCLGLRDLCSWHWMQMTARALLPFSIRGLRNTSNGTDSKPLLGIWQLSRQVTVYQAFLYQRLAKFLQRDYPRDLFLVGFLTLLLPCGQTLLVFSACALEADLYTGLLNGALFAIITSPSLWLAMQLRRRFQTHQKNGQMLISLSAMLIGLLALLRGFAELGWISHFVISPDYHLVIW